MAEDDRALVIGASHFLHGDIARSRALLIHEYVLPMVLDSSAAVERATISELPPGANGTTKRIGRLGQPSSAARAMPGSRLLQARAPAPVSRWRREMLRTSRGSGQQNVDAMLSPLLLAFGG
jgi:hypothetical protein